MIRDSPSGDDPGGLHVLGVDAVSIPDTGVSPKTGYPFNATRHDFERALRDIPTRDLRARIETWQFLAIEHADDRRPGGKRAFDELQIASLVAELERRKRVWERSTGDLLRPRWPNWEHDLHSRVAAVKTVFPIDQFCSDLLGASLQPSGLGRWKARCPLPGHDDRSPSFTVYQQSDSAWCFGCNRGGDIIQLTGYAFGMVRFFDCLERLECEAGITTRGAA